MVVMQWFNIPTGQKSEYFWRKISFGVALQAMFRVWLKDAEAERFPAIKCSEGQQLISVAPN